MTLELKMTLAKYCFFTDHLKHKTINSATSERTEANLRQLCLE